MCFKGAVASASKKQISSSLASPGEGPQHLSVRGVWPDSFSHPAELKWARTEAGAHKETPPGVFSLKIHGVLAWKSQMLE